METLMELCIYCGEPGITTDHVIPQSKGGSDDANNLVPACNRCNSDKAGSWPWDWKHGAVERALATSAVFRGVMSRQSEILVEWERATQTRAIRGVLVGAAEIRAFLGVSRQRMWQLAQKRTFPEPLARLEMGNVWLLSDINSWWAEHRT